MDTCVVPRYRPSLLHDVTERGPSMVAYGYIRKSVVADDSTTHSPEVQRDRIVALAKAHGD